MASEQTLPIPLQTVDTTTNTPLPSSPSNVTLPPPGFSPNRHHPSLVSPGHLGLPTAPTVTAFPFGPTPHVTSIVTVKLDADNYPIWLSLMTSFLSSMSQMPYVDGSIRQPAAEIILANGLHLPNPELSTWTRINHSIRGNLLATMSSELMLEFYDILPAYDIWSAVRRRFLQNTLARELELRDRLLSLRLTNQGMASYLRDLKSIGDQLATIGKPLPPSEMILYALRGLPSSYESLVTTLSYSVADQTFDQIRAYLLNYEQRLRQLSPDIGALYSASSPSRRPGHTNSRPRRRFNTRGAMRASVLDSPHTQHTTGSAGRSTPPSRPRSPARSRPGLTSDGFLICQICGRRGHAALTCSHRFNRTVTDVTEALAAVNIEEEAGTLWYPDSGATDHMTHSPGMLNHYTCYDGQRRVYVGDAPPQSSIN
ncbi:hypothetical protein MLD38_040395 [Melastoma candidum]|uniref:Uncharacterized protein n=1 Tax=Melastoma candidum TaxID=119954 RepID=A0ACB9L579_9MYRT|nr:hypothetical protein MLD38_040395 [Melastoma candidum]